MAKSINVETANLQGLSIEELNVLLNRVQELLPTPAADPYLQLVPVAYDTRKTTDREHWFRLLGKEAVLTQKLLFDLEGDEPKVVGAKLFVNGTLRGHIESEDLSEVGHYSTLVKAFDTWKNHKPAETEESNVVGIRGRMPSKAIRELLDQGKTIAEIAEATGRPEASIEAWIKNQEEAASA